MKLEFCEQCHRYHEHPVLCGINFMKASEVSTPTQQELNVRFAKALGWTVSTGFGGIGSMHSPNCNCFSGDGCLLPNYFAPENFHLVRAAVDDLDMHKQEELFAALLYPQNLYGFQPEYYAKQGLLSPVEHIITAYLKVKE